MIFSHQPIEHLPVCFCNMIRSLPASVLALSENVLLGRRRAATRSERFINNDVAVGSWDSPQEFLHSSYNVRNGNSKDNKSMNHFGFSEGYRISTTPEQDAIMRNSFSKTAKLEYDLIDNNCATAVQKAMVEAGIPVSEPKNVPSYIPMPTPFGIVDVFNGYQMKCNFYTLPSSAFQSIMKWNPSGSYIHK